PDKKFVQVVQNVQIVQAVIYNRRQSVAKSWRFKSFAMTERKSYRGSRATLSRPIRKIGKTFWRCPRGSSVWSCPKYLCAERPDLRCGATRCPNVDSPMRTSCTRRQTVQSRATKRILRLHM